MPLAAWQRHPVLREEQSGDANRLTKRGAQPR